MDRRSLGGPVRLQSPHCGVPGIKGSFWPEKQQNLHVWAPPGKRNPLPWHCPSLKLRVALPRPAHCKHVDCSAGADAPRRATRARSRAHGSLPRDRGVCRQQRTRVRASPSCPLPRGCAEQLCSRSQLRARPHRGLRRLAAPPLQDIALSRGPGGFTQNHPLPPLSPEPHSHESLRGGSARERVSVPRAGEQPGSPGGKTSWPLAVGKTAPARTLCPQHRQLGAAARTRGNRQVFRETLCWMQR